MDNPESIRLEYCYLVTERLRSIIADAKARADASPERRDEIADAVMPFFAELRRREMEELKEQYEEEA